MAGERLNASKLTNQNILKKKQKYSKYFGMKKGELEKQDFNNKLKLKIWTVNQANRDKQEGVLLGDHLYL